MSDINIQASVLKWAREKSGFTLEEVGQKLEQHWKSVNQSIVHDWEEGNLMPEFRHIQVLAEIYKRPIAVFFLQKPPTESQRPADRRTLNSVVNSDISPKGILAIRRARYIQDKADSLYQELGLTYEFPFKKCSLQENPVDLAKFVRKYLDISIKDQFDLDNEAKFFKFIRTKIEDLGVLVLKTSYALSFPLAAARAFSFADKTPFLILINNSDTESGKLFSLLHELAHVLIRETSLCNDYGLSSNGAKAIETFCNIFAANFLVPTESILENEILRVSDNLNPLNIDNTLKKIASKFKVSRQVILRRLHDLNLVSESVYSDKFESLEEEFRMINAIRAERAAKKGGGRNIPHEAAYQNNGKAFTELVFEAQRQDKISYFQISDYLSLKTKYLPDLQRFIGIT